MCENMRILFAIFSIILILFSIISGCIFSDSDDNGEDKTGEGFKVDELTYPEIHNLPSLNTTNPKPVASPNATSDSYRYETSWAFAYNQVFTTLGGVMQVWLTNLGESQVYIYEFGLLPEWGSKNITKPTAKIIMPSEKMDLGFLAFPGPDLPGEYTYQLKFGLMVRTNETSKWYDWGLIGNKSYIFEVQDSASQSELTTYGESYNPLSLYNTVNDLIDPMQKDVRGTAVSLAKRFGGNYNVYQVCEIFEYVKSNISYVNDPKGDENYWASPDETLTLGAGDCEDQALLIAALITSISGTARVYFTDSHAFSAVYIGDSDSTADNILRAFDRYYGTALYYTLFHDELGYWLVLDPISSMHVGGLPLGSKPADVTGDVNLIARKSDGARKYWNFTDTETLYIIDIK